MVGFGFILRGQHGIFILQLLLRMPETLQTKVVGNIRAAAARSTVTSWPQQKLLISRVNNSPGLQTGSFDLGGSLNCALSVCKVRKSTDSDCFEGTEILHLRCVLKYVTLALTGHHPWDFDMTKPQQSLFNSLLDSSWFWGHLTWGDEHKLDKWQLYDSVQKYVLPSVSRSWKKRETWAENERIQTKCRIQWNEAGIKEGNIH